MPWKYSRIVWGSTSDRVESLEKAFNVVEDIWAINQLQ